MNNYDPFIFSRASMNRRDAVKLLMAAAGSVALPYAGLADAGGPVGGDDSAKPEFTCLTEDYSIKPTFTWLRFGDVMPLGWIKEQMTRDLQVGFAGRLDQLCNEAATDIFANGRNTLTRTQKATEGGRDIIGEWWNGETQGNWRTGFVMLAYLSGDATYMRKADAWVQHVLAFQDEDGYLGIHDKDTRYKAQGDLWTQACLLRGLLAYAELTRNGSVLTAVRRAVDLAIELFHEGKAKLPSVDSHDLMISDVLERLFELTGDDKYRAFALSLYENWDWSSSGGDDGLASFLNRKLPLMGHGVHTVENVRVLLWLWMATGREDFGTATRNAFDKLERYAMLGGSVVSSEAIADQAPDPSNAEFEYCTTKETLDTYMSALEKIGDAGYAERVERVFFNDAQASRLPDGSAIAYLTSENRFQCNGRTPEGVKAESANNPANKFSPTHRDVAVCCNPNATQVAPLYVRGMWMRHRDGGLVALLYGPCMVTTTVGGTSVKLEENTNYPFGQTVEVVVHPEHKRVFSLYFRDPQWSRGTKLKCDGAVIEREGDFWKVSKRWKSGDRVSLAFVAEVQRVEAVNGEFALQYGALLYALPIAYKQTVVKTYPMAGFEDSYYEPDCKLPDNLAFAAESRWQAFGFEPATKSQYRPVLRPFDSPVTTLRGEMVDKKTGIKSGVELVPFGCAPVLRRLTFPVFP